MSSSQFELSTPPTDAISALKFSPTKPTLLLVASWDRKVYLYDTHAQPGGSLLRQFEHRAPVLDVCWGADNDEAYSCGLDWDVRRLDLQNGEQKVLSSHSAGVRSVVYSPESSILISASWDSTLHIHSTSPADANHAPAAITLPSKPFSLSLTKTKLVVAMASRVVHIYELSALATASQSTSNQPSPSIQEIEPWQRREPSLKFMTRAVACMPNGEGYASSSIEGRVAVEWFDPSPESQARKYAFKCHRQPVTSHLPPSGNTDGAAAAAAAAGGENSETVDVVYPVNALAFHPVHSGNFASGGGDGVIALWDGAAKRRIRQYQRYPASIAALDFSCDGRYLAIGSCPGFEDGKEDLNAVAGQTKVFIRELGETEARGKGSK
ncbi:MAG: hypothetical protein M1825_002501 [Sarcosagium campestre]|nr:MAG: hypothetical protein M1825_002501 [Sarcosagium campestre]